MEDEQLCRFAIDVSADVSFEVWTATENNPLDTVYHEHGVLLHYDTNMYEEGDVIDVRIVYDEVQFSIALD